MERQRPDTFIGRAVGLCSALVLLSACASSSPTQPPEDKTGEAASAVFTNGDFEPPGSTAGLAPPAPWNLQTFLDPGITVQTPQTYAGLNLAPGGNPLTTVVAGTNQADPDIGPTASLRYCRFGTQCARINFHSSTTYGNGRNANQLSQTMTVGAGDVDPTDSKIHVRFAIAPVLQDAGHPANQQPYFFVQLTNVTKSNAILFQDFNYANQAGVTWKTYGTGTNGTFRYTDWTLVDIAPGAAQLQAGDQVTLLVVASGCSLGLHEGYVYLDGVGAIVPGLFVSGSAPAQVNPGSDITYTFNYKNGSSASESSVVIDFTTPPNTTFQSITPPAGATCTTPAVGSAGTVVCTFASAVAAGASGSFTVTVGVNAGTTGTITAGQYDIKSAQESALVGNKIYTNVGCTADADCSGGAWCMESTHFCTAQIANGGSIPTDAPHTSPTLNGTCTAAAGALVCVSGVCDTADNKCGYANGDGACTSASAGTVCRSGVCDPDGKCGYAVGDGPCTTANQGTVCRSGTCSIDGTCIPAGGCNVDADCTGGNWCMESTHTCTAPIANGGAMPNDPPHTSPTLDGTCSSAAATLVCASGVCDSDNRCGFANGDGPCNATNGGTVCRSGACSVNGTCMPAGGCNVDGDCAGGAWCNISAHTCTPKVANGGDMPTDTGHTAPVLDGTCTALAGALVCAAQVCDTDNKCGLLNNDGPCTAANGATVCRSGVCDADGKCGLANGDGTCTTANAALLCRSAVCDPDGKCGYAVGDGPCDSGSAALVCRTGACSVAGTCMPAGGCNVDADCTGGSWCQMSTHTCTAKLANGAVMPIDGPHANPTLDGTCTTAAGTLVCASAVCDTTDDRCGFANGDGACDAGNAATICRSSVCDSKDGKCGYIDGDGPCTLGSGPVVCRSGVCSPNGAVCMPVGGCAVDADCGASEWCNTQMFSCRPKLANGLALPTIAGHTPTLDGTCTTAAGAAVCDSGVCDTKDNLCGYAEGDGPCTAADGIVVCRSGLCSATGTCIAASACNADADCDAVTQFCNTETHLCAAKLPNGMALPSVTGHTPTLDGVCSTVEAPVVCQSGVCDVMDNKCGYANGDGPCTITNAGSVCRSSTCSPNAGVCVSSGGCAVDADCASTQWCNTETFACVLKIANGGDIPSLSGHTPALQGTCDAAVGAAVCQSGVCDTNDNKCGFANGDGPCTTANAGTVCREGACSSGGVCTAPVDCAVDSDCDTTYQYCDTGVGKCAPKLPNGSVMPGVLGHSPVLDGTCSDAAAQIVCQSGVCDAADGKCGHAIGKGPCDSGNGAVVCRSTICATSGPNANLCVECVADTQCAGVKPVCDTAKNACGQCTPTEDAACTGATPVCVSGPDTCAPCDGDLGGGSAHACSKSSAPYCFLSGLQQGECGVCASNADCEGHAGGTVCDKSTGVCTTGCTSDAECGTGEWCNAPANGVGSCVPKLDNGTALPTTPPGVATCSDAVGARVCKSGVCDKADNTCGLANGDGPCTTGSECRSGSCDAKDQKCGYADGDGPCSNDAVCRGGHCDTATQKCGAPPTGCKTDADCKSTEFCKDDGTCSPKLDLGKTCGGDNQCKSGACHEKACDEVLASGNGLICAARPGDRSSQGAGAVLFGLMLAAAGVARRRRR